MSDVGDDNFMRYVYRGEEGEIIPQGATHITVREDVRLIRERAFVVHPNIIEVICHEDVKKIETHAFDNCPRLRKVIMPGVTIVEDEAFADCKALADVECDKLEIVGKWAFFTCESLSFNLSSARIVKEDAFSFCEALTAVKFGSKLERIQGKVFVNCTSLARITIPFKDGLITHDGTFQSCENLNEVYLVEGGLHETIAELHSEEWRNDMYEVIDEINQTLPTVDAGDRWDDDDVGEKAVAIRTWIRSVLTKINEYKEQHRRVLDEDVAPSLQNVLPQDIVRNSVIPFLELPSHEFD